MFPRPSPNLSVVQKGSNVAMQVDIAGSVSQQIDAKEADVQQAIECANKDKV